MLKTCSKSRSFIAVGRVREREREREKERERERERERRREIERERERSTLSSYKGQSAFLASECSETNGINQFVLGVKPPDVHIHVPAFANCMGCHTVTHAFHRLIIAIRSWQAGMV